MSRITIYMSAGDAMHGIPVYELTMPTNQAFAMLENSGFVPEGGGVYADLNTGTIATIETVKEV